MKVQYYMALPYNIIIRQVKYDGGRRYFAAVREMMGCTCQGATFEEVYSGIREAMESWIEDKLEKGREVPLPAEDELPLENAPSAESKEFSGRVTLRMPKSLHARLSAEAKAEAVSLNQYIVYRLSDFANPKPSEMADDPNIEI